MCLPTFTCNFFPLYSSTYTIVCQETLTNYYSYEFVIVSPLYTTTSSTIINYAPTAHKASYISTTLLFQFLLHNTIVNRRISCTLWLNVANSFSQIIVLQNKGHICIPLSSFPEITWYTDRLTLLLIFGKSCVNQKSCQASLVDSVNKKI